MTPLEELIATADKLCKNLERAADNERRYSASICLELERYSWEVHRMANDIRELKASFGG
jgi:hypothetical protein